MKAHPSRCWKPFWKRCSHVRRSFPCGANLYPMRLHRYEEAGSMACLISSSTTSNWILTATLYSCSVESGLTGSKRSITKETASAFSTNGTKTDVSNGREPAKKQNRSLISSCAGSWRVWIRSSQKQFRNGFRISLEIWKILKNAGKSDGSMV